MRLQYNAYTGGIVLKKLITAAFLASLFVLPCLPDCETVYYSTLNDEKADETLPVSYYLDEAGITYAATESETDVSSFPAKFDLRDYGIISGVKNQGKYGTCWAIAASDSIETQLRRKGTETDLSEWHLAYFAYKSYKPFVPTSDDIFNSGGTNTIATATLARWHGMISESEVPYDSAKELDSSLQYKAEYKVTDVLNTHPLMSGHVRHSTDFMKELIYGQNAVAAAYYSRSEYYNEETNSHYCTDDTLGIDHAVILLGWDDSYPKENFTNGHNDIPEKDGAWLAKNSWGDDWGNGGYFWISYEDKSLCEAGCYSAVPGDTYSLNYQYDETGWAVSISADANQKKLTGYMSSIFTAENSDPVTAVAFYTTEDDADYEVSVYSNVRTSGNNVSPVNGTLASSVSGTQKYTGYHTVVLDTPVNVSQGEKFSVVVKLTNHTSPYVIPMEASSATVSNGFFSIKTYLFHNYANLETDPSYISLDGQTWYTTTGKKYSFAYPNYLNLSRALKNMRSAVLGNTCVKAFSSPAGAVSLPPDTPEPPEVTETPPPVTTESTPPPPVETDICDINRDGNTDAADFVLMQKMFWGENPGRYSADINEDGKLNITDLVLMKARLTDVSAVPVN